MVSDLTEQQDENAVVPGLMAIGEAACVSVHGASSGNQFVARHRGVWPGGGAQGGETVTPGAAARGAPEAATEKALDRFDRMRNASGSESAPRRGNAACDAASPLFRSSDSLANGVQNMDGRCQDGAYQGQGQIPVGTPIWLRRWNWRTLSVRRW